jgi:lipid A ethanolaminephosphotransferase
MKLFQHLRSINLTLFAAIMSVANFLFFHIPFFTFVSQNVDFGTFNGWVIFVSLVVLVLVANFFAFYLFCYLFRIVGKVLLAITFVLSALSVYFIRTYNVILDESMMGNVFNTQWSEASGFFHINMILWVLVFGILPSVYIFWSRVNYGSIKRFSATTGSALALILVLVFANASNWLWIDKNSKVLGALVMPWSYTVNTARLFIHQHQENEEEILLPDATIENDDREVVVLVIGESARRQNFSLYGYKKETNPLLAATENLHAFRATSCATYTTAGVKCILEHDDTGKLYEILPNYLHRNGADVVWRTTNWGEPPIHIEKYQKRADLEALCDSNSQYDEVLLAKLKDQIESSDNAKTLIVLHTSTSHGPQYSQKYPPRFERFTPVCNSVELANCTHDELINAYDNSILYTDFLLQSVINLLQDLDSCRSAMIFVSDHGESLGEGNLYMHGVPISIAPSEQYEIPFIVWTSDNTPLKPIDDLTQHHVFHSVLRFLHINSPVFDEEKCIFER